MSDRRSDLQLEHAIVAALSQDNRIDVTHVSVDVEAGLAKLTGRVTHAHEKRLLEDDVRNVIGIVWVSNEVEVVPSTRRDQVIAMDIEEILALDSALYEFNIETIVDHGAVTLRGEVPSRFHRNHASAVAARVLGVKRIKNELQIVRKQPSNDEELQVEVQERLAHDAVTAAVRTRIEVSVEAGIVTLSGDVDTLAQRKAAARVATQTPGVKRVRNEIAVDPYPFPGEDPPGVPWDQYEFDYRNLPSVA